MIANSGRERTSALVYAVGWTQHSAGVQIIRAASILQLLLGNVGRPGGGVMAERGHASIQGSTDVPTLYDLLPGYLRMPRAREGHLTLKDYIDDGRLRPGWWSHFDEYVVSLLKAWFGDAATEENDYGFAWLPKISGNHSHFPTMLRAVEGGIDGMLVMGQNPAVSAQHAGLSRRALARLKWLVVRDFSEIETATFWRDAPEIQSGELRTEEIETEVFLMASATHIEKEGTFTNTQRLLQYRDKALEAPGAARSELWFMHHLVKRVQGALRGLRPRSRLADPESDLGLPGARPEPRALGGGGAEGDERLRRATGRAGARIRGARGGRLHRLRGAGSTAACTPTASTRRGGATPVTWTRRAAGCRPSGGGPGRRTGACSTAGRPPIPRGARGRSASATSGGTRPRDTGRATTSPTSPRTSRRTTGPPTTRKAWTRSPATSRSS